MFDTKWPSYCCQLLRNRCSVHLSLREQMLFWHLAKTNKLLQTAILYHRYPRNEVCSCNSNIFLPPTCNRWIKQIFFSIFKSFDYEWAPVTKTVTTFSCHIDKMSREIKRHMNCMPKNRVFTFINWPRDYFV